MASCQVHSDPSDDGVSVPPCADEKSIIFLRDNERNFRFQNTRQADETANNVMTANASMIKAASSHVEKIALSAVVAEFLQQAFGFQFKELTKNTYEDMTLDSVTCAICSMAENIHCHQSLMFAMSSVWVEKNNAGWVLVQNPSSTTPSALLLPQGDPLVNNWTMVQNERNLLAMLPQSYKKRKRDEEEDCTIVRKIISKGKATTPQKVSMNAKKGTKASIYEGGKEEKVECVFSAPLIVKTKDGHHYFAKVTKVKEVSIGKEVFFGRGGATYKLNQHFNILVEKYKKRYKEAPKTTTRRFSVETKEDVAREVMRTIQKEGGNFINEVGEIADEKKAMEKIMHALRAEPKRHPECPDDNARPGASLGKAYPDPAKDGIAPDNQQKLSFNPLGRGGSLVDHPAAVGHNINHGPSVGGSPSQANLDTPHGLDNFDFDIQNQAFLNEASSNMRFDWGDKDINNLW